MTITGRARRTWAAAATVLAVTGACSYSEERERVREAERGSLRIDAELVASLQPFEECDDLLDHLRTEGAKVVGPWGFGGGTHSSARTAAGGVALQAAEVAATAVAGTADAAGAPTSAGPPPAPQALGASVASEESEGAAVAGTDYSGTNVQEEGVDEPDLVKTDGKRLVTFGASGSFSGGRGDQRNLLRVVDLTGDEPRLASSLSIGDQPYLEGQLFLHGDKVVVLHAEAPPVAMPMRSRPAPVDPGAGVAIAAPYAPTPPRTAVTVVDISDLGAPKVVEDVVIDGDLVAARMLDGVARLVLRSGPPALPFLHPSGSEASVGVAEEANEKLVAESTLDDWLPRYRVGDGEPRRLTACEDVSRPDSFSGLGMLSVVTIDADDPRPGPAATILGAGETVYASAEHLYVTSSAWPMDPAAMATRPGMPEISTDIHKFDIGDEVRTTYLASGRVKGRLLNSFSMSEHEGDLRVATTDDVVQESSVTVLREQEGALAFVGGVGGLGKTERIYAVRFIGDRGYVVTFRQTDPLYVLDLADPAAPKVTGELKIPGYSAYLHPISEHQLIGVGQDATDEGRVRGTQLSLFDVSDPANPKRLANATLPQAHSEAEYDHHAFLWWARSNLAVIPVMDHRTGTSSAVGFSVAEGAVEEVGRVVQRDRQQIRRSIVLGDRLLTLSSTGLQTNDLGTLAEQAYLAY